MTRLLLIVRCVVVVVALVATALAHARPAPPITDEPTATTVAAAPPPGLESGRTDADPGEPRIREVVRGALFLPRVALTVAFVPVEGSAWAFERYQIADRAEQLFFNDAGTIGIVPTLALESGFGVNVGARFVMRDMLGQHEHFDLRASTGGRFHEKVATTFRTGDRLGRRNHLVVRAELERRPKDSFYGIGNVDEDAATYRHRLARVATDLDSRVVANLHVRASAALADHTFGPGESGRTIDDAGLMDEIVGLGGVRNAYGELELRWDSRRRASTWEVSSVPGAGSIAAAFAGRITALDAGADFWRYGFDLQHFISLGDGPRVLSFRSHGEAVTGDANDVPFIELARLGGGTSLRGYAVDRFRDRIAVSGSAEYQWDLARSLSASLFVDAGWVGSTVRDFDPHDLRVGYGAALDLHSARSFIARTTLASSIDGGVFLTFALDPVSELEARTERR